MCQDLFLAEVPHVPCGSIFVSDHWVFTFWVVAYGRFDCNYSLEIVAKLSLQVTDKKVHNGKILGARLLRVVMKVKGSEDQNLTSFRSEDFGRC